MFKKNTAVPGFTFGAVGVDGSAKTGLSIVGKYLIDGNTGTAGTISGITEVSSSTYPGMYKCDLSAVMLNGNTICLSFINASMLPVFFTIKTYTDSLVVPAIIGGLLQQPYALYVETIDANLAASPIQLNYNAINNSYPSYSDAWSGMYSINKQLDGSWQYYETLTGNSWVLASQLLPMGIYSASGGTAGGTMSVTSLPNISIPGVSTTFTIEYSGTVIPGVSAWVTKDAVGSIMVTGPLVSDINGNVTFVLQPGNYYLWRMLSGYSFATNPIPFTVS